VSAGSGATQRPSITIVGGGSTHWTPTLLVDFANSKVLRDAQITLVDRSAESLPPMQALAEHIAGCRGIGLGVRTTTDLAEGLRGADAVISAITVGGFESMRHDLTIPASHGIHQPVGDSVGPGGIFRALRSVPVVVSIAREMERGCPDALLVNVSNPLTALCRGATRETSITTVGLCNELVGFTFSMSLLFDVPMHEVVPVVAGVNHLPLISELTIGGQDGFVMLRDALDHADELTGPIWMDPPTATHWHKISGGRPWNKADVLHNNRLKLDLFLRFGVLPGSADTHVSEFFPGFVTPHSHDGRDWGVHHYGLPGHMADKESDNASVAELMASEEIPGYPSGELVADLLDARFGGRERTLPVNLPNTGQVTSLPEGPVVEVMGVSGPDGVRPCHRAAPVSYTEEILGRVSRSQEVTVEAALSGERTLVLEAMLTDPMTGALPYEEVVTLTDELFAATAPWLPQFGPR
jgi:alpha-galactosidase